MMPRLALALLLCLSLTGVARAAPRCTDCVLEDGAYHTALPAGWDGHGTLKLLIFLHGYGASGRAMIEEDAIGGAATRLGFLVAAPDGRGKSWGGRGMPPVPGARDDVAFIHAVLRDVERRWPIDRASVVLGGFSVGGAMTWQVACTAPQGFTAFLPMSGALWLPLPEHCAGPIALSHLHGRADTVVPLEGRVLMQRFHMAAIAQSLAVARRTDRCSAPPRHFTAAGGEDCTDWAGCAAGGAVQFCLHPGGHELGAAWTTAALRWALAQRQNVR